MARNYLEIIEDIGEDSESPPLIVQIEVEDIAEARARAVIEEEAFAGMEYTTRFHVCRHENDPDKNQPCEVTEL